MPRTIVVDACLLITFGNAGKLALLSSTADRRIVVPPRSAAEVAKPPASLALQQALRENSIGLEAINVEEVAAQRAFLRFNTMPAFRDRGEAEVLALADSRTWMLGSDDEAVRRVAARQFGRDRLTGSLDFLVWAVREKRLTLRDARELLDQLDVGVELQRRMAAAGVTLERLV